MSFSCTYTGAYGASLASISTPNGQVGESSSRFIFIGFFSSYSHRRVFSSSYHTSINRTIKNCAKKNWDRSLVHTDRTPPPPDRTPDPPVRPDRGGSIPAPRRGGSIPSQTDLHEAADPSFRRRTCTRRRRAVGSGEDTGPRSRGSCSPAITNPIRRRPPIYHPQGLNRRCSSFSESTASSH